MKLNKSGPAEQGAGIPARWCSLLVMISAVPVMMLPPAEVMPRLIITEIPLLGKITVIPLLVLVWAIFVFGLILLTGLVPRPCSKDLMVLGLTLLIMSQPIVPARV
ncbi:MAG: hypothetical protein NUV35_00155, partial [Syntrophomonadaceae bacterium]|nr:hypothetical protein [Syntrophomonadaceae bacterium]